MVFATCWMSCKQCHHLFKFVIFQSRCCIRFKPRKLFWLLFKDVIDQGFMDQNRSLGDKVREPSDPWIPDINGVDGGGLKKSSLCSAATRALSSYVRYLLDLAAQLRFANWLRWFVSSASIKTFHKMLSSRSFTFGTFHFFFYLICFSIFILEFLAIL